jgi:hypothetical protein
VKRAGLKFVMGSGLASLLAIAVAHSDPPPSRPDPIEALQQLLAKGERTLAYGDKGYLPAVLDALDIRTDSQVLVFSKTSLQFLKIGPRTPRALYFNDDTTVGSVQGGRVIEIATTGANGVAFYSLDVTKTVQPKFAGESGACLGCHASTGQAAPGMIVANFVTAADGTPLFIPPDHMFDVTDSTTPFDRRWGGWYVTGQHGLMHHNGNVHLEREGTAQLDPIAGLNLTDLSSKFDVDRYLAPTSDIVALMTFEHQVGALNRIWSLQRDGGDIENLVAYMVGVDEAPLPSPVTGVSSFTTTFTARGPFDDHGRSLRDFDLKSRLFRYPLSYTIYSRAFDNLDPNVRDRIYQRLFEILSGQDKSGKYAKLTREGRRAALEIVAATKPDVPDYWRAAAGSQGLKPKA